MLLHYEKKCLCGCGLKIPIKTHHKYYGIPKYIIGHNKQYKKNEYIEHDNKIEILLRKGNSTVSTFISKQDKEKVLKYTWSFAHNYVRNSSNNLNLHRFIMDTPKHLEVDHIDRNPLNNTRENLRNVTRQTNSYNKGKNKNNTSGYKGVRTIPNSKRFQAYTTKNYKQINLGWYDTIEEAAEAKQKYDEVFFNASSL